MAHDIEKKCLVLTCEGIDHQNAVNFALDLQAHGGQPERVVHVCQDMNSAYAKWVAQALAQAQISYDRFNVVATANEVINEVRRLETGTNPP